MHETCSCRSQADSMPSAEEILVRSRTQNRGELHFMSSFLKEILGKAPTIRSYDGGTEDSSHLRESEGMIISSFKTQ